MTDPDADALLRRAAERWLGGDTLAAEIGCREVLALRPGHRDARTLLGAILHDQGRYGEAEPLFLRLTEEEPAQATHWMNLGTIRRSLGRLDESLAAFAMALRVGPLTADLALNLGLLHLDRRDFVSARAILERASRLRPRDAAVRLQLAEACHALLDTDAALTALRGWEDCEGIDVELMARIAQLLVALGAPDLAGPAVERVRAEALSHPRAGLLVVGALERINRVAEAKALLESLDSTARGGELDAEFTLARGQLASREGRHDDAVRSYGQLVERTNPFHERYHHLFPLARSLDALGRYDEAWQALEEAHRSQVAALEMTAPGLLIRGATTMEITRFGCDPEDVTRWDATDAPDLLASPIFVVAFPRSGTTLLELTLDAHPALCSMDEQAFLQNALDDILATGARYPAGLAALTAPQLAAIRDGYWRRVADKVTLTPGQRLIDKNPLNLLRLPVIARVFPNARIVLAVRDPRDVLLSCSMQHFRAPDFAMLCRDLPTLALGYRRAFDFWYAQTSLLPCQVREIRYERFVTGFEQEVRALADFLALEWDDALLQPAQNALRKPFISTPSYSQVVQPVSARSVGRHLGYARQFAAVEPLLKPYLERWGYA